MGSSGVGVGVPCVVVKARHVSRVVGHILFKENRTLEIFRLDAATKRFSVTARGSAGSHGQLDHFLSEEELDEASLPVAVAAVIVKDDGATGVFVREPQVRMHIRSSSFSKQT